MDFADADAEYLEYLGRPETHRYRWDDKWYYRSNAESVTPGPWTRCQCRECAGLASRRFRDELVQRSRQLPSEPDLEMSSEMWKVVQMLEEAKDYLQVMGAVYHQMWHQAIGGSWEQCPHHWCKGIREHITAWNQGRVQTL